jgi:hypothetical protein
MATPAPTTPSGPPTLPTSSDPESTFDTLWDGFNAWLATILWPYLAAVVAGTFANATEAEAATTTATAQAAAAVAAVGAVMWVGGTNYAAGAAAWSPITLASYRTGVAGISTTDPSLDTARWTRLGGGSGTPDFVLQSQGII